MNAASSDSIAITVNGKTEHVPRGLTVEGLLRHLGVRTTSVGVERNRQLVRRAAHATTPVEAGDRFEIVTFVGGG